MNAEARRASRRRIWVVLGLIVLGLYAVFSVGDARSAEDRLAESLRDLAEMQAKIDDIQRLKRAPKVAALQLESPAQITNRVAAARQLAGLPESSLLREQPMEPQRIGRTDFEIRSTVIDLAASSLPQIIRFCDGLWDPETGTVVRDLKLSEPPKEENGKGEENWEAVLILTQMIFSPKSR